MRPLSFYVVLILIVVVVPFVLDYYVFRHWRRFVRRRAEETERWSFRWTLPLYRTLLVGMPAALVLYFLIAGRWALEPRLLRWVLMGAWVLYYAPKLPVALVLLFNDAARAGRWLLARARPSPVPPPADQDGAKQQLESRRQFLREAGWAAAGAPFVMVGYNLFRTLYNFQIRRIEIPLDGLPRALDGFSIAQISDLHAGSLLSDAPIHEIAQLVEGLQPDLIALTGDYVNSDAEELGLIEQALGRLEADLGVYGCLGNHDHYASASRVRSRLAEGPVEMLVNAHRTLRVDGARLHLVGTDNTGFNQHFGDLPAALGGIDTGPHGEDTYLLLAHDPTFWDNHVRPAHPEIDLMLCGHTHGGQVGLEAGPYRWSFARIAYERWAGLYSEPRAGNPGDAPQYLYVNRGVGTVGPPFRMGIPPEITLITLRRPRHERSLR